MAILRGSDGAGCIASSRSSALAKRARRARTTSVLATEARPRLAARRRSRRRRRALAALATLEEVVDAAGARGGGARRRWAGRASAGRGARVVAAGAAARPARRDARGRAPARVAGPAVARVRRRAVRRGAGQPRARRFRPRRNRRRRRSGARYPGKAHEVGWRSADAAVRDGVLLPGRPAASRRSRRVAYVVTFVHSDRDRPAALRLGSPGPVKVWVNGAAGASRATSSAPRRWTRTRSASACGRGWNRILIKTVVTERRVAALRARDGRRRGAARRWGRAPAAVAVEMARRGGAAGAAGRHAGERARTPGAAARARGRAGLGRSRRACSPGRTSRDRDDRAASTAFARALERLSPPGPTPRAEPALRLAAADATDDDDERAPACWSRRWTRVRRRSGARCCWRGWAWPRAPRGGRRRRWRRGVRRWRSIPPAGRRRWRSPRRRRTPGCR